MKNWFVSGAKRLWRWISGRPKRITIPATVVVVAVLSFGIYLAVDFWNYMDNDPDFCNSCHIMEESWDKWASSEHAEVGCHSCHHQSIFASAALLVNFIFGDFERIEEHSAVPDHVCEECHESNDPKWIQVAATAGHEVHAEGQNIACTKCHSVSVHRFEPPGPICSVCHEDKHVEMEGMASMHCTACHEFLVHEEGLLPHRAGCLECHEALVNGEGITWPADAPMQYECGECHKPHEQAKPVADCAACHTTDGMHTTLSHSATPCITCHKPHAWYVTERDTCMTCHPDREDHFTGIFCGECHIFIGE